MALVSSKSVTVSSQTQSDHIYLEPGEWVLMITASGWGVVVPQVGSGVYSLSGLDYSLNGYIDEFRFRKEAIYDADFTPTNAPFTY